ncbi:hypothetical protein WN943_015001 [Citrus x changshan-huyou]
MASAISKNLAAVHCFHAGQPSSTPERRQPKRYASCLHSRASSPRSRCCLGAAAAARALQLLCVQRLAACAAGLRSQRALLVASASGPRAQRVLLAACCYSGSLPQFPASFRNFPAPRSRSATTTPVRSRSVTTTLVRSRTVSNDLPGYDSAATRAFSELECLGSDYRGVYYRGKLPNGCQPVAVKRFSAQFLSSQQVLDKRRLLKEIVP